MLNRYLVKKNELSILESTTKFEDGRWEVGLVCSEVPSNYGNVLGQLRSLQRRLSKDDELKTKYHDTIKTDLQYGFIKKVSQINIYNAENAKIWFLPHQPVFHSQKPGKVRRVFNAASKYQGIFLNDNLLPGPDLLLSL